MKGLLRIERQTNGKRQYSSILDLRPLYEKLQGVVGDTTGVVGDTTEEEKRRKTKKKLRIEREKSVGKSKPQKSEGISDEQIKQYVRILHREGKVKNPDVFIVSTRKALREGDLKPDDILKKIQRHEREGELQEFLKKLSKATDEIYFNGEEIKNIWENTSKENKSKHVESVKKEAAALKGIMTEEERKEVGEKLISYAMLKRYEEVKYQSEATKVNS